MREHMTATVRGLVVFGAVWQALWFVGDPTLRGTVTAGESPDSSSPKRAGYR